MAAVEPETIAMQNAMQNDIRSYLRKFLQFAHKRVTFQTLADEVNDDFSQSSFTAWRARLLLAHWKPSQRSARSP